MAKRKPPRPTTGGNNNIPAPTGLTATAMSPTQVNLSWNAVTNATSYWIYRTLNGKELVPAIIQDTSYIDKSVATNTTYLYAVAAVVSSTLGAKSLSVGVTTL